MFEGRHQFVRSLFGERVLPFMLIGTSIMSNVNYSSYIDVIRNYFSKFTSYLSNNHKNLLVSSGFIPFKNLFFGVVSQNVTTLTVADVG